MHSMSESNFEHGGDEHMDHTGATATASDPDNQQAQGLLSRIGNWFRRSGNGHGMSSHDVHIIDRPHGGHGDPNTAIEARSSFLRPWARRDAAINQLQEGFTTLTDLMSSVRDHLDRQSKRQDELMGYLSHLPQALEQLPEASRMHGEALKAIHEQLAGQNINQEKLGEILEKLNTKGLENREVLDEVRERVDTMRQTDQAIADNLTNVGAALQTVTKSGHTTSQVLEQMRDNLDQRDGQLERVLHRQGVRFTTMLSVAIFLSIAALVAVGVIAYLVINQHAR